MVPHAVRRARRTTSSCDGDRGGVGEVLVRETREVGDRRHHVTRCVLPPPRFRLEGARSFQPAAAFGKSGQREPSAAKLSARPPLLRPPPLRPPPLSPHNSAKASSRRVGASADRLSGRGPRQHLQTSHTSHTHTTLCARISEIAEPGLLPEWQPPRDRGRLCAWGAGVHFTCIERSLPPDTFPSAHLHTFATRAGCAVVSNLDLCRRVLCSAWSSCRCHLPLLQC